MGSFCLGCGNSISEDERFCPICGRDPSASGPRIDPGVAFGLAPETSGKAIFSLVCGLLFIILPLSIVAVVFGHLSLSEIRRSAGRLTGKGLAITGIVLGYIGVVLLAGFVGLATYYGVQEQRNLAKRADMRKGSVISSESSVVSAVRTLNTAEIAYAQAHHDTGYTCSLSDLSGVWGIGSDLARGRKNGYIFELQNCTAAKVGGPIVKYRVVAYPTVPTKVRSPAYCSDESDIIRIASGGSASECLRAGITLSESEMSHPKTWSQASPR
jgi:hypothetical protein